MVDHFRSFCRSHRGLWILGRLLSQFLPDLHDKLVSLRPFLADRLAEVFQLLLREELIGLLRNFLVSFQFLFMRALLMDNISLQALISIEIGLLASFLGLSSC